MRTKRIVTTLVLGLLASSPVLATSIVLDFAGILTNTTDSTGTIFRNGTQANSGAGTTITGHVQWDLQPLGMIGGPPNSGLNYYEADLSAHYSDPALSPFHWSISVGGLEFNSSLNYGTHNNVMLYDADLDLTPNGSEFEQSRLMSLGHYQTSPTVNGVYDYLEVQRVLSFQFYDPSGSTINGLDFTQSIDWTSGIDGYGTGGFSLVSQLRSGGTDRIFSGTLDAVLMNGGGGFVLTSLRSSQVPEPATVGLMFFGLGGILLARRRRRTNVGQAH